MSGLYRPESLIELGELCGRLAVVTTFEDAIRVVSGEPVVVGDDSVTINTPALQMTTGSQPEPEQEYSLGMFNKTATSPQPLMRRRRAPRAPPWDSARPLDPCGIPNMSGADCFWLAPLQCIRHLRGPLPARLLNIAQEEESEGQMSTADKGKDAIPGSAIVLAVGDLFAAMQDICDQSVHSSVISGGDDESTASREGLHKQKLPSDTEELLWLRHILAEELKQGGSDAPSLVCVETIKQKQQDAHEFLEVLLDRLGNAPELKREQEQEAFPMDDAHLADIQKRLQELHRLRLSRHTAEEHRDAYSKDIVQTLQEFAMLRWYADRNRLRSEIGATFEGQKVVTTECLACGHYAASDAIPFIIEEVLLRRRAPQLVEELPPSQSKHRTLQPLEHNTIFDACLKTGDSENQPHASEQESVPPAVDVTAVGDCGPYSSLPMKSLLEQNFRPQRPEAFKCEKCGRADETQIQAKICRLPQVFAVHINRAGRSEHRIDTSVDFADSIDLSELLLADGVALNYDMDRCSSTYQLQAACFHQGVSARSGHYFALVKRGHTWVELNDSWCEEIDTTPQHVERGAAGPRVALLFYVRDDKEA